MSAAPYPVVTETAGIPVADGGTMSVHLVGPAAPGPWPAVIVGFEMFGVTDYIRETAARIAAMGHVVVVPDFYHRTSPGFEGTADEEGRAAGLALLRRLERAEVRADLEAVLDHLAGRADTTGRVGMVGFSLGGHLAYFAATQVELAATAVVYPGWLDVTGTALGSPDPLLALTPGMTAHGGRLLYLIGADDHVVTADQNRLAERALTEAGIRHEVVVYPDTPHGFLADRRDTYRPEQAADAWRRIADLLGTELAPGAAGPAGGPAGDPARGTVGDPA